MFNWLRATAVAIAMLCVSGCGELSNRGGFTDYLYDRVLFRADAKGHRVLRSYVLVGSLVSIARRTGLNAEDQQALSMRILAAHEAVNDAFVCAFESSSGCVFFDDKMLKLDHAIFSLAVVVLIDYEKDELVKIKDKFSQAIPVVAPAARALGKTIGLTKDISQAVNEASDVVESLITLGFYSATTGARVTALYRDSIEMDMRVILDRFARECAGATNSGNQITRRDLYYAIDKQKIPGEDSVECRRFLSTYRLYNEGNANFDNWRSFIYSEESYNSYNITPTADHFIAVSRLVWNHCRDLMGGNDLNLRRCRGEREPITGVGKDAKYKHKYRHAMLYACWLSDDLESKRHQIALGSAEQLAREGWVTDIDKPSDVQTPADCDYRKLDPNKNSNSGALPKPKKVQQSAVPSGSRPQAAPRSSQEPKPESEAKDEKTFVPSNPETQNRAADKNLPAKNKQPSQKGNTAVKCEGEKQGIPCGPVR